MSAQHSNNGRKQKSLFGRRQISPVDPLLHRSLIGMAMALIELGRFDEAVMAAKKAVRQNPAHAASYRCLACAFAHLDHNAQAREAAAGVLEHDPTFTISTYIARGGQAKAKRLIEGLRKAGLPD